MSSRNNMTFIPFGIYSLTIERNVKTQFGFFAPEVLSSGLVVHFRSLELIHSFD